jgi:hypothetical protein
MANFDVTKSPSYRQLEPMLKELGITTTVK